MEVLYRLTEGTSLGDKGSRMIDGALCQAHAPCRNDRPSLVQCLHHNFETLTFRTEAVLLRNEDLFEEDR